MTLKKMLMADTVLRGRAWVPFCTECSTHISAPPNGWKGGKNILFLAGLGAVVACVQSELRNGRTRILTQVCPSSKSVSDHSGQSLRPKVTVDSVGIEGSFPTPFPTLESTHVCGINELWVDECMIRVSTNLPKNVSNGIK